MRMLNNLQPWVIFWVQVTSNVLSRSGRARKYNMCNDVKLRCFYLATPVTLIAGIPTLLADTSYWRSIKKIIIKKKSLFPCKNKMEKKIVIYSREKLHQMIAFHLSQNCVTEISSNHIPHRYAVLEAQYHLLFLDSPSAASLQ